MALCLGAFATAEAEARITRIEIKRTEQAFEGKTFGQVGNDPTKADDAGNGFLMRQGVSILHVGWDATADAVEGNFTIRVPVAVNADGSLIMGPAMTGDLFDYGPEFSKGILTQLPPKLVGTPYPALVPKTDADGNDIAGVRLPDVTAPIATYAGWALRAEPAGANDGCDGAGQMIPFAKTKAERTANEDPRPSLEERYPTHEAYVTAVRNAANELKAQRLLLDEDVQAYVQRGGLSGRQIAGLLRPRPDRSPFGASRSRSRRVLGIVLQEPAVAEVLLYPRGAGDVVPLKKRSMTK